MLDVGKIDHVVGSRLRYLGPVQDLLAGSLLEKSAVKGGLTRRKRGGGGRGGRRRRRRKKSRGGGFREDFFYFFDLWEKKNNL